MYSVKTYLNYDNYNPASVFVIKNCANFISLFFTVYIFVFFFGEVFGELRLLIKNNRDQRIIIIFQNIWGLNYTSYLYLNYEKFHV